MKVKSSGTMKNSGGENRQVHLDLLRILACFSVVMLHSAAQFWYTLPVTDTSWKIANAYDAVFRFGVPVFVMISGALFLQGEGEVNLKRLYVHNILRIVVLYVVWSVLYGLFDCVMTGVSDLPLEAVLCEIFAGRYHLWYLPMTVGIYMLLPVLKKWVQHAGKKDLQYFLLLFLVFQVGRETVAALWNTEAMNFFWGVVELEMVCGYLGYFVLGYYLVRYGVEMRWRKWIYLIALAGSPANIVLSTVLSTRNGSPTAAIYDSFGVFTFATVVSLFVIFTTSVKKVKFSAGISKLIKEFSLGTLGIYLLHIGAIEFLESLGFHSMMFAPIICIPVYGICIFMLCFAVAALLRRIPLVGKYIC